MMRNEVKLNNKIVYAAVVIFSILFLFMGNRIAGGGVYAYEEWDDMSYYTGRVTRILDRVEEDQFGIINITIYFEARITWGSRRGEVVQGEQHQSDFFVVSLDDVQVGDRVLLAFDTFGNRYFFADFARINAIAILGVAFLVLVIVFGRMKGLNAIVALGFTCMAVFLVFIPAILAGHNIHITTLIICLFAIVSTLLLVVGPNKKALAAMLGCLGGVFLAALLMFIMDRVLALTGMVDQETQVLLFLENPVDLRALIFAGVILGAVGAIMDVAMSIASSLWEVREAGGVSDFKAIMASGINIGKDILGTMLNTLILAYIGSSLSLILLINVYTTSYLELLNMELIIVEFIRALVGSFGMFLTIPLTAGICGWLYTRMERVEDAPVDDADIPDVNHDSFLQDYYRRNRRG